MTSSIQCNFCYGPAHPATGCVYGSHTIACHAGTREFWRWAMLDIDLNTPPERRWEALVRWRAVARELLAFYVRDIGGLERFAPLLRDYCDAFVAPEYIAEMRGVAGVLDAPEEEVLLPNLYYDA